MTHAERMSPVDTTWLRMDRPNNPMVIVGVMQLDGPVDPAVLATTLARRFLVHDRFRQRVEKRASGLWWVDDRHFDLSRHIHHVRLPGAAGDAELEHFVGELAGTLLDRSIPLWQFHIVEEFQGGAAVVVRIHHAIADGIALIGVMLALTDEMHGLDEPAPAWVAPAEDEHGDFLNTLISPVSAAMRMGSKLSGRVLKTSGRLSSKPAKALGLIKDGTNIVSELAGLLFMANDSQTPLKGKPHGVKRVAWADPLPLGEVKAVAHALGCSVNDILMSCVAGAINAYLAAHGEKTDGVEIRSLIPVNLRPPGSQSELGNEFGIVTLVLPVGIADPIARVAEVRRRMLALKQSYQAPVTYGLLAALGFVPQLAQDALFGILLYRATAVMTNVPGPQSALYIAGSKVTRLLFWVPQSGDIGVGVSILSYDGKVQFGLITDASMVADPGEIIRGFRPQFEQLLYYALLDQGERTDEAADGGPKRRRRRTAVATPAHRPPPIAAKTKPKAKRGTVKAG